MKKLVVLFLLFTSHLVNAQIKLKNHLPIKSENAYYNDLLKFANTLKVIDVHEHLLSAKDLSKVYLSFWNFFSDYV